MLLSKPKQTNPSLNVLTDKKFENKIKSLEGKGMVKEQSEKCVTVEHLEKNFSVQFNSAQPIPAIPIDSVLEKIVDTAEGKEVVFKSKGGRTYKVFVNLIFIYS